MSIDQQQVDAVARRAIAGWDDLSPGVQFRAREQVLGYLNAVLAEGWVDPTTAERLRERPPRARAYTEENDRLRAALVEIRNALGPNAICTCPPEDADCGLREEAADALRVAREALKPGGIDA